MAKATTPLLDVMYRQTTDPLMQDVYVSVYTPDPIRLAELAPAARLQMARHLRELATTLEENATIHTGPRALLIVSGTDTLLAYKDPP